MLEFNGVNSRVAVTKHVLRIR